MKKMKSICCLLLAIVMVFTAGACGAKETASTDQGSGAGTVAEEDVPATRPAANTESLSAPKYEITDTVVEVVVDEDFTGKDPEKNTWARVAQSAKNHYGIELKPIVVPTDEQTGYILTAIASNNAPDIIETQKLPGWFPKMCADNTFVAISDYVNFKDLLWKDEVSAMENYKIGNKYYALSLGGYSPVEMVYNKKLIKNAGLTDPMELYKKGEWTWSKLLEYVEALSGDINGDYANDIFGVDDTPMAQAYLTSMGTGITQMVDGKVTLNPINGGNYEKLGDFLNSMCRKQTNGYMPDPNGLNGDNVTLLAKDKLAFSFMGRWGVLENKELTAKMKKGDLALVMAPRHDDADKYYCYGVTSGYAIPSSGNVVGAIATLTSTRLDDYPSAERLQKVKQSYIDDGWDEDSAHILTYDIAGYEGCYQKATLVSLGIDMFNTTMASTVNDLLYDPLYQGTSFRDAKSLYLTKLENAVEVANMYFNQ